MNTQIKVILSELPKQGVLNILEKFFRFMNMRDFFSIFDIKFIHQTKMKTKNLDSYYKNI